MSYVARSKLKLDCGIKTLDLSTPAVMGILNITPDSFYDGGKYNSLKSIGIRAEKMIEEGAGIIDVGGYSTRPGAKEISEKEELKRVVPAIKFLRKQFPKAIISIDTFRSEVAVQTVEAGANIINDVSGGTIDPKMLDVVARLKVPYLLMHIKGTPQNMQEEPKYKNVTKEVKKYFTEKIQKLKAMGAGPLIIDPGFGFGKNLEHNYELLKNLSSFSSFKLPILVGISRKSMINKILKTKPKNALNGTVVGNTIALMNGANILRVHDVKEAKDAVKIVDYYKKTEARRQ